MRHGWLEIPGVQTGDRTFEDQINGVELTDAPGSTVLDLGCAEGLIAREFAKAGAKAVVGVDAVPDHIIVARQQCAGLKNIQFEVVDLNLVKPGISDSPVDIVLALGVLHKLQDPAPGVRWAARKAAKLLMFRPKGGVKDGQVQSKHFKRNSCNAHEIFKEEGLRLDKIVPGSFNEQVEYWRR